MIKFLPSCAPRKGSAAGRKFLASPYYSQRALFASPMSAFLIWRNLRTKSTRRPRQLIPQNVHNCPYHAVVKIPWNIPRILIRSWSGSPVTSWNRIDRSYWDISPLKNFIRSSPQLLELSTKLLWIALSRNGKNTFIFYPHIVTRIISKIQ